MQKEMEERLKRLAQDFKEATNIRMADMMHNTVRRNVALNHELNSMLKVCQDLEIRGAEYKENDRMLRLQCELLEAEARIALAGAIRQRGAMHDLAREHVDTVVEYGQVQRENARLANYELLMSEYKARCATSEERARTLERHLQETRQAREEVLAEVRTKCEEFDRLNESLNEVKRCIAEALQVNYSSRNLSNGSLVGERKIFEIDASDATIGGFFFLFSAAGDAGRLYERRLRRVLRRSEAEDDLFASEYTGETRRLRRYNRGR